MTNLHRWFAWIVVSSSALIWPLCPPAAHAIDLLNDNIPFSASTLELRPFVRMPFGTNDIISMTTKANDPRLWVTVQEGGIYVVNDDGNGNHSAQGWFDVKSSVLNATGRVMFGESGQQGLQSTAFHPGFDDPTSPGYGKFYTTLMESRPASTLGHHYLGDANSGDPSQDSVLVEWTYDHEFGYIDPNTYREVFRARLPGADHMIKQAKFNPYARPGDEDYGLLYVSHGDSSGQSSAEDRPQHLDGVYGKLLRIDPLQSGLAPYSVPASNPFAGSSDPNVLKEIYAYGFRNPHTYTFNLDDAGNVHILVGDIGRANVEEINLVTKGGNYGWPRREGTFVHSQAEDFEPNSGYYVGVSPLPANEANLTLGYTYPVAQFDHNNNWDSTPVGLPFASVAVSSGFVIRNGSDPLLHNQLIFTNFANADGNVYHTDFAAMLNANTKLDTGEVPGNLTQAALQRMLLGLNIDCDPSTLDGCYFEMTDVIGASRTDARFGEGVFGEMYISNKSDRWIYLVTNSVPLAGDYNKDHVVNGLDYVVWRNSLGDVGYHLAADGSGDGKISDDDFDVWKQNYGQLWPGASGAGGGSVETTVPEANSLWLACATAAIVTALWRTPDFLARV